MVLATGKPGLSICNSCCHVNSLCFVVLLLIMCSGGLQTILFATIPFPTISSPFFSSSLSWGPLCFPLTRQKRRFFFFFFFFFFFPGSSSSSLDTPGPLTSRDLETWRSRDHHSHGALVFVSESGFIPMGFIRWFRSKQRFQPRVSLGGFIRWFRNRVGCCFETRLPFLR